MQFAINLNENTSIMNINQKLGIQLKELRTISRLTQAQAAEKAGISIRTLHALESGTLKSYVNSFQKVCEAYNATLFIKKSDD